MYRFNIILTEVCNANCSHCYMKQNGEKLKKTMSIVDIDKIIESIPQNTESIVLTGGEILLFMDLLIYTIKKIKLKNKDIKIELESNGKILYDKEDPKLDLKKLKKLGVSSIRFSDDLFHESGGINLKKVRDLALLEDEDTVKIKFLVQEKVLSIGNATNLESKYKEIKNCMNKKSTVKNPYLFIDVDGNVSLCTWKIIPHIGNLINEKFSDIESRLKEDFNNYVLKGEILRAINIENFSKDNKKYIELYGECMLCSKIFSKNKK